MSLSREMFFNADRIYVGFSDRVIPSYSGIPGRCMKCLLVQRDLTLRGPHAIFFSELHISDTHAGEDVPRQLEKRRDRTRALSSCAARKTVSSRSVIILIISIWEKSTRVYFPTRCHKCKRAVFNTHINNCEIAFIPAQRCNDEKTNVRCNLCPFNFSTRF